MRGRFTAAVVSVFIVGLLATAAGQRAHAEPPLPASITVTGNRSIDAAAIRSHLPSSGRRLDATALDTALKSLYSTGLFSDVKITRQVDDILIVVVENPTIDRVAFEGNKKIKDDDLKKAVQSKTNGPLSRAIVHNDAGQIVELYRQRGYFDVKIDPQTIKRRNGRVTLVFVIKEGDKLAVQHVEFAGNEAFSATKLRGAIKTGESNALSFLTGNDTYNGTSPTFTGGSNGPWASFANVNGHAFGGGSNILFQGGQTFSGAISFGTANYFSVSPTPSSSAPITFGSYGTGRATISSGATSGKPAGQ